MSPPTFIRTFSKPSCRLCGTSGTVLYSGLSDCLFSAPGTWQFKQCGRPECGFVWLDPAPLPEDLELAYQNYYTHTESVGGGVKALLPHAIEWTLSAALAIPSICTGLFGEQRKFKYMMLCNQRAGRLLDVGCGDGEFLRRLKKRGWQVTGIDFDSEATKRGRAQYGLDLMTGDFQAADLPSGHFDAITMSHVIEHVPDPIACFEKCRMLLKPNGRLVAVTPNAGSLGHRHFGQNWRGLEPPRHLQVFGPKTLRECAQRAGLNVARTGTTAVNADYFVNTSIAIERASGEAPCAAAHPRLRYVLGSTAFQYRERLALRSQPDLGEEAFLVATRV